jgi:hypothetical protein
MSDDNTSRDAAVIYSAARTAVGARIGAAYDRAVARQAAAADPTETELCNALQSFQSWHDLAADEDHK